MDREQFKNNAKKSIDDIFARIDRLEAEKDKAAYFEALDQFKIQKRMDKMVDLIIKLLLERYNEVNQKLH